MIIDRDTTIKQLLDVNEQGVINALITLNKNFSKLKNPVLRKLLAKRVSIADACKIAKCKVHDFLMVMNNIGFQIDNSLNEGGESNSGVFKAPALGSIVEFDVRPLLSANKDPLKQIMLKVNELKESEGLKIVNTFEPFPLIKLLEKKGFRSHTDFMGPDLVITYFYNTKLENKTMETVAGVPGIFAGNLDELLLKYQDRLKFIDVTTLEMPKPMVMILENLETLKADEALFVHHKKVPVYLLPHLHDKGFDYLIQEEEEAKVSMLIYKP